MAIDTRRADGATRPLGDQLKDTRREFRQVRDEVAEIAGDLRVLAQKEVELARAEFAESINFTRNTAVLSGAAAIFALLTAVFAAITLMFVVDTFTPQWAAAAITLIIVATCAALAGYLAMQTMKRISVVPKRTIESMNEDVRWARSQLKFSAK